MDFKAGDRVVLDYGADFPYYKKNGLMHGTVATGQDYPLYVRVEWDDGGVSTENPKYLLPEPIDCPEHVAHVKKLGNVTPGQFGAIGIPVDQLSTLDSTAKEHVRDMVEVRRAHTAAQAAARAFNDAVARHRKEVEDLKAKHVEELAKLRDTRNIAEANYAAAKKRRDESWKLLDGAIAEAAK